MTCRQIENLFEMERMASGSHNKRVYLAHNELRVEITDVSPGKIIRLPEGFTPMDVQVIIDTGYTF